MTIQAWLTFVFTASIILIIPGPTIIYVVGQSLTHGKRVSIPLSIGVISGDALCITASLLGLSAFLTLFSSAFLVIKYLGAAYLIFLGVKMIRSNSKVKMHLDEASTYDPRLIFKDVFLVNSLNPKGIIFYSAFMPQFINHDKDIVIQFLILSATFLCLALLNVFSYTLLASKTKELFKSTKLTNVFNLTGGLSLICAGIYSATLEKD